MITDSEVDDAYPLALLTYVLVREFYYVEGNVDGCKRVAEMVKVSPMCTYESSGTGILMTPQPLQLLNLTDGFPSVGSFSRVLSML